jgi:hypothetical protein
VRQFRATSHLFEEAQATTPQSHPTSMEDMSTLGSIKRPRKTNTRYMNGLPIDGNGVLALP